MSISKIRKIFSLSNIFLTFSSLVIPIVTTEFLLSRFEQVKPGTYWRYIALRERLPSSITYEAPPEDALAKSDSLINKKYRIDVSSKGYINPSRNHKNPDKVLLFLGGSTTENIYVEENNRFPYLTSTILERYGMNVNSYNGGVSGNTSIHSITSFLAKGIPLDPDIVFFMHNVNDLKTLFHRKSYWIEGHSRSIIKKTSFFRSFKDLLRVRIPHLYRRLTVSFIKFQNNINFRQDEFADVRAKKIKVEKDLVLDEFEKNLHAFIKLAKTYKVTPILLTQPNRLNKKEENKFILKVLEKYLNDDFGMSLDEYIDIYNAVNNIIIEIANEYKVLVIDLASLIPKNKTYMYDYVHLTDEGNIMVAEIISNYILDN